MVVYLSDALYNMFLPKQAYSLPGKEKAVQMNSI
jgi:hypothetical protein